MTARLIRAIAKSEAGTAARNPMRKSSLVDRPRAWAIRSGKNRMIADTKAIFAR
jgi:hypothetical protein